MNFSELYRIIDKRKKEMPQNSYVTTLFRGGVSRIAKKVGEEAIEVVVAAKNQSKKRLIEECADLFFHIFALMRSKNITLTDVYEELAKRHSKSKSV